MNDSFELYDLRVELIRFEWWRCVTDGAQIWDYFEVRGENIFIPDGKWFSFYNLAAIIPLLAAKQRVHNHSNDWMELDDEIHAPDANCWAIFKIHRTGKRTFYTHLTSWNKKMWIHKNTTLRDWTSHARIINGCWQFSEWHSHQTENPEETIQQYINAWHTVFDGADIYTWVEELLWKMIQKNGLHKIRFHTKHVPDLLDIQSWALSEAETQRSIFRSLERLGIKKLSNVQFHWWDYTKSGYEISIKTLEKLQKEGYIEHIWVTNTNVAELEKWKNELWFIPISSQNQYSIIDRRPKKHLIQYTKTYQIALYCYGSLMWWLLSDRYLRTKEPSEPLENRSLRKYLRVIHDWGNWELFQELLLTLSNIWNKHWVSISEVAAAWVLHQDWVSSIIVGIRSSRHLDSLDRIYDLHLDCEDIQQIDAIYEKWIPLEGDVFDLERNEPRHRDIMKFNLNKE